LFGQLAQEHSAGGHQGHCFVELSDGPDDVKLRQVLFRLWAKEKGVAIPRQQLLDKCVGALWHASQLRPLEKLGRERWAPGVSVMLA
jgi:hypothetical protein